MKCPHCHHELTEAEARSIAGALSSSLRKTKRGGWTKGKPRKADAPRCNCNAMTAKRAEARGHRC